MRYAGYHYEESNGKGAAIASIGAHPNAARHMTDAQRAAYGPYRELARFPWTRKGKAECIAFCDSYNVENFPEFAAAVKA